MSQCERGRGHFLYAHLFYCSPVTDELSASLGTCVRYMVFKKFQTRHVTAKRLAGGPTGRSANRHQGTRLLTYSHNPQILIQENSVGLAGLFNLHELLSPGWIAERVSERTSERIDAWMDVLNVFALFQASRLQDTPP